MARDPYDVLRVPRNATAEEIRDSFRRLSIKHHPDKNPNDPTATERFAEISAAHDILSDPEKRAALDAESGAIPASASEAVDFFIASGVEIIGRARNAMGDESVGDFAAKAARGIATRAATPEGREQLKAAGSLAEQALLSLFAS